MEGSELLSPGRGMVTKRVCLGMMRTELSLALVSFGFSAGAQPLEPVLVAMVPQDKPIRG